jgi:hypothetical protein
VDRGFQRWAFGTAALLLCSAPLFPQPVADALINVAGRVVDENNTPAANVRIALRSKLPLAIGLNVTSDIAGAFSVRVAPGEYSLTAECEGFFAIRDRPVYIDGTTETLEISLSRLQQTSELINVSGTVAGVDTQDTTAERRLTGRQLLDIPYPATRDFKNALRAMPGVLRHPSGALTFDGGMENQVFYSLDGFNISDPITGGFTTRLPLEAVRSVSYSSGRYSPEFGKGSAGALAIQTTNGDDKFRYSATNFIPGIDTGKGLHIGTWSPRVSVSGPILRGRAWFSENIDAAYTVAIIPDLPSGQDRTTRWRGANVLHGQVNLAPSHIMSFDLVGGYENAPRTGLSALDPVSTSVDHRSEQYFGSVKDQMYFGHGMVMDAGYAHMTTRAHERPQGSAFYVITPVGRKGNYFVNLDQESARDQVLVNLFLPSFTAAGTHQLKTGVDFDVLHYAQNARRTGFENYDRDGTLLSRTTFGGPGSLSLSNLQASSYVVDVWRLRSGLTLEYGIRQDWEHLVGRSVLSPRFAFAYSPFESDRTRFAGGYAVVHDASSLAMFARTLDQYSLTTRYSADGLPVDPPGVTVFSAGRNYRSPRYSNVSLGAEHQFPHQIRFSASLLRRRGSEGFTYARSAAAGPVTTYELANLRHDTYDSVAFTINQTFGKDYVWMMNYTRSRALSNAVMDISVDQPLHILNNLGRQSWDTPHRLLSWGYLPAWSPAWAFAYLLDIRTGIPFSVVRDTGEVVGVVNSRRYPANFALNVHLERRFHLGRHRFALRAGINNVTNAMNATGVNNVIDSPNFLQYYGKEGRHGVFRLRWLKQGE